MSTETTDTGYGYSSDEVTGSPFSFGLNAGDTYLTKFEWIPNGGKDGAEQEALDIMFTINGTSKGYRKFPVLKAFTKVGNIEITDPNAKEVIEAKAELVQVMVHILKCFADPIQIETALAKKITTFKELCQIAASVLPKKFEEKKLDVFMQYQWTLREAQKITYLDLPQKMKHGKWLCPAQEGNWKEVVIPDPSEKEREALIYVNAAGEKHGFIRNGWFMKSAFAIQQKAESVTEEAAATEAVGAAAQNGATPGTASSTEQAEAVQW